MKEDSQGLSYILGKLTLLPPPRCDKNILTTEQDLLRQRHHTLVDYIVTGGKGKAKATAADLAESQARVQRVQDALDGEPRGPPVAVGRYTDQPSPWVARDPMADDPALGVGVESGLDDQEYVEPAHNPALGEGVESGLDDQDCVERSDVEGGNLRGNVGEKRKHDGGEDSDDDPIILRSSKARRTGAGCRR